MNNEQTAYVAHLVWLNMLNDKRSNTPAISDTHPGGYEDICFLCRIDNRQINDERAH
jgi:hypothetical protein